MRIGLVAPPWLPVPPLGYGGTEKVLDVLATNLRGLGHDVVLFTVGTSTCPVTRRWRYAQPAPDMGATAVELAHVLSAYESLRDAGVDVIHDHTVAGPLVARGVPGLPPVVATHHGVFDDTATSLFTAASRRASIVCISQAQRDSAPDVQVAAVIRHGVDVGAFRAGPGGEDLAFVGRMARSKGLPLAIRVARRSGRRLQVMSKMWHAQEIDYFEQEVRPLLGDDVVLLRESGPAQLLQLLRHAAALVNPIRWDEPFGLVMAEALACGTPVIAFPEGAAPEIVDHGVTGFLCRDEQDMVDAVGLLPVIDRRSCRSAAEERFDGRRMAVEHVELYERVLDRSGADLQEHPVSRR